MTRENKEAYREVAREQASRPTRDLKHQNMTRSAMKPVRKNTYNREDKIYNFNYYGKKFLLI